MQTHLLEPPHSHPHGAAKAAPGSFSANDRAAGSANDRAVKFALVPDQATFCEDAARLAALVCGAPLGALLLPSEDGIEGCMAWRAAGASGTASPDGSVGLARIAERIVAAHQRAEANATEAPRLLQTGDDDGAGFWAGVCLHTEASDGAVAGVLCVAYPDAAAHGLTDMQAEGLATLARQTAALLNLAPAAAAQRDARKRWEEADARAHQSREEAQAATLHAAYMTAQATATTARAQADKKRFCHDVIRCVTQGRFRLADETEFPNDGAVAVDATVRAPEEYPPLRGRLRAVLLDAGMEPTTAGDFLVAIGEAVTNSLKHAQGGQCTVKITPDMVRVRVSDDGPGIAQHALPDTILKAGFSTKTSLGMGFTLMLEMADAVWLATDENDGAAIQLEKWIRPDARPAPDMPDLSAWDAL